MSSAASIRCMENFIDELAWDADSRTLFVAHGRGRLMVIAAE